MRSHNSQDGALEGRSLWRQQPVKQLTRFSAGILSLRNEPVTMSKHYNHDITCPQQKINGPSRILCSTDSHTFLTFSHSEPLMGYKMVYPVTAPPHLPFLYLSTCLPLFLSVFMCKRHFSPDTTPSGMFLSQLSVKQSYCRGNRR